MKPKLLSVLHYSPPLHGASKVGDIIKDSEALNDEFNIYYIKIKSANTLEDIGKINLKKIYLVIELFFKVLWALLVFRPNIIYFTASVRGVALYRDIIISVLWKLYGKLTNVEVFYHYHTKGVNDFVSTSSKALRLTKFFVKGVNLILLNSMLKDDFHKISTYKSILFLANGVENPLSHKVFDEFINKKYENKVEQYNILYLSNMIEAKGYFKVIELATLTKDKSIHYHFAGGWQSSQEEKDFFRYIEENGLTKSVTFHGFVKGVEKEKLFKDAHFFVLPSRDEAFPLTILEAFSYGVPVLVSNVGAIPDMVSDLTGILLDEERNLFKAFEQGEKSLLNKETANACRKRYLENYSLLEFEQNLITLLSNK